MTENQTTPTSPPVDPAGSPPPGTMPPPRPTGATVRLFARSSDDKIVAGVCGGLGRATNVDPIVYRVLAVVLTFFGGAGLLLYALGWLLLPEDRTGVSLTERALGRGRAGRASSDRTRAIALTILLVLVAALAVAGVVNDWTATVLVLVVGGAIFLLLRRDGTSARGGIAPAAAAPGGVSAGTTSWYAPAGTPAGLASPVAGTAPPGSAEEQGGSVPPGPTGTLPPPGATGTPQAGDTWATGPGGPGGPGQPVAPSYADFGTPPPPPRQPRAPAVLGPLTVSVLLISLGVLAAVDASGASVAAAAYPALALLVIGGGLLVGTWYGRSRGLIALGVLAALALPPTIAADVVGPADFRKSRVQNVSVTDVGAIRSRYDFDPGRAELDFTAATFTDRTIRTQVDMPAGELRIVVPENVDVAATVNLRVGDSTLFGKNSGGFGVSERVEDLGADGRGGGVLELRVDQGLGSVEVEREAA